MREAAQYLLGIAAHGVITAPSPGHVTQAACGKHRVKQRAAKSGGCAKEPRGAAADFRDSRLRGVDFLPQCAHAEERECIGMAMRMVLDAVAAPGDRPHDFG